MIVLILRARKKSCLVHLPDNSKFNQCENKTEERGGTEWSILDPCCWYSKTNILHG